MKLSVMMAAVAAAGVATGAAVGSLNQTIHLGDIAFAPHATTIQDDPILEFTIQLDPNPKAITGIHISFNYDENPLDSSWASDLGMTIQFGADGPIVGFAGTFRYLGALVGAYGLAAAEAGTDFLSVWDFNGGQSGFPGFYQHKYLLHPENYFDKPDFLIIRLTDTWNGGNSFNDFTITLQKIPAPGAIALLGLAGLAGSRRRRTA